MVDKFKNNQTKKTILTINDDGKEIKDEQYFEDLKKKKKEILESIDKMDLETLDEEED